MTELISLWANILSIITGIIGIIAAVIGSIAWLRSRAGGKKTGIDTFDDKASGTIENDPTDKL